MIKINARNVTKQLVLYTLLAGLYSGSPTIFLKTAALCLYAFIHMSERHKTVHPRWTLNSRPRLHGQIDVPVMEPAGASVVLSLSSDPASLISALSVFQVSGQCLYAVDSTGLSHHAPKWLLFLSIFLEIKGSNWAFGIQAMPFNQKRSS